MKETQTECSRFDPVPKEVQITGVKIKSTNNVLQQEDESSGSETEAKIHAKTGPAPKPWNPPPWIEVPLHFG